MDIGTESAVKGQVQYTLNLAQNILLSNQGVRLEGRKVHSQTRKLRGFAAGMYFRYCVTPRWTFAIELYLGMFHK